MIKENSVRIMVVDDSESVRELLALILKNEGFNVTESCNGKDALNILDEVKVDMLLTDLYMPEMDGLQLVKKLRDSPKLRSMPVIMVSSENHEPIINKAKEIGVNEWLAKPFIPSELMNVVRKYMNSHEFQRT